MFHTQYHITKCNEGTLCITSTAKLSPLSFSVAFIIENPVRKPGDCHIFASGQKWPDFSIKDFRGTFLIHPS
jgi:hypothetical protein